MPSLRSSGPALALCALLGCSETEYDLISDDANDSPAAAGGSFVGDGDGPSMGIGGAPVDPTDCTSTRAPDLTVVRIQAEDGRCLSQGDSIILGSGMGHDVDLVPCDESVEQRWTIEAESGGVWEIRNEASNMNLDVKFADTVDGTEFVLYTPHELYNQRFFPLPSPDGTFALAPRHVMGKCAEVVDGSLQLLPCDAANPLQRFEEVACSDQ